MGSRNSQAEIPQTSTDQPVVSMHQFTLGDRCLNDESKQEDAQSSPENIREYIDADSSDQNDLASSGNRVRIEELQN